MPNGEMGDNPLMQGIMQLAGQQQQMADQQSQGPKPKTPNPMEMVQAGLLAASMGLKSLGMEMLAMEVVQKVQKGMEKMVKMTEGGRQQAGMAQGLPAPTPPGVGPMPGTPMT